MEFERFEENKPAENADHKAKTCTPESLRKGADKIIDMFSKNFTVAGVENLEMIRRMQLEQPDNRFVITASHLSNLDGPAAIKAFGEDLDLQMAVSSQLFGFTPQELLFRAGGKENFTGVEHKKIKGGHGETRGAFNPNDFIALAEKSSQGKTPWIAISGLSMSGEMLKAKIGPAYLAQKTHSYIIPSALEMKGGGSISVEGLGEMAKAVTKKAEAIYHVGTPIKLEPVDVKIIEDVLAKRKRREKPTKEELAEFSRVVEVLRVQTEQIAKAVSTLLPEKMRGKYGA
ncbi:MAG: hypothetical protein AAB511_00625 [Patescibacteria group bacterium]|mgnify:CR=1 FL=1